MEEKNLNQYKQRVNEVGQALQDIIASVALGKFDVEVEIPEDIEVFADVAVGLRFMIENLRELVKAQEKSHLELEQHILERTRELENTIKTLQMAQQQQTTKSREEYAKSQIEASGLTLNADEETHLSEDWVSRLSQAVEKAEVVQVSDGQEQQSLALPIRIQDEIIGVLGFNRDNDQQWTEHDITTVQAIVEQVGLALENQRLFDQTQNALTETESLYQANQELNTVQTFTDILGVIQRHTILNQNPIFVSINLFDQPWTIESAPDYLLPIGQWATSSEYLFENKPLMFTEWPNATKYLKPDTMTYTKDLEIDSRFEGVFREVFMEKQKAKVLISTPLLSAGQWIGQILASFPRDIEVTEGDRRRLMTLAGQAAVAIQNLNLFEETMKRASQLETAADIARQSSGMLDTDSLLNTAVNLIRDRFGFYHASIFVMEGLSATVHASTGEAGRQMVASKHSLVAEEGTSIIGHVCFTGEPLIVNDVSQNPVHRPHPLLPETRAELGIPLKIGNRVTGALDVQSTKINAFSEDDVVVIQTLADQIAVALDNARSFEVAQKAVVEIREADRLKSEFLANMSHELRTPLNSIIGFSRVILKGIDGPINDLQQQDLEAIHHSGQHLLDMINNILDLSKIEAGKMELSIEEMDIADVIKSVAATARGLIKEQPVNLIDKTPDELPLVLADRTRIRQIMLNLLQNATKFTEEGEIIINTEVIKDEVSALSYIKISVSDTGIGIAPENQENLFERFSQVDSSLTRKVGGTGLGLSISKHLVEMQGGIIDLISEQGKGSTFWFTVPLAIDKPSDTESSTNSTVHTTDPTMEISELETLQEEEMVDVPEEEGLADEIIAEIGVSESKVILSIDDDVKVISLYSRYLAPHGYQVAALTDSTKALQEIKKINPYAITLDIMMPHKDGWQVIQEIKSDPELSSIPIIICSITEDRERAYQLGAVDYLVKPILEEELVTAIKNLSLNENSSFHDVLIIDDDPKVFHLIKTALHDEPSYHLQYANGGFQGLEMMKEKKPDAVILDLIMPDLDGFSILETMQGDPELRRVPVIILTAADLSNEERSQIEKFKRDFLLKDNFRGEDLLVLLENALEKINQQ